MPNYQKNQLLRHNDRIIRVLAVDTDVLTIDCLKRTMPQWMPADDLQDWEPCDETALPSPDAPICDMENLTPEQRKVMRERFTQLTELGVRMVNLPPYRPELKGIVEHAFELIQNLYKPHLHGVIRPDFQERGAPDYRRAQGMISIETLEIILLRCILYYNNNRLLGEQVLSKEMVIAGVQPAANSLWRWGCAQTAVPALRGQVHRAISERRQSYSCLRPR